MIKIKEGSKSDKDGFFPTYHKSIKFNPEKKAYKVLASKRETISRQSRNLSRTRDHDGYPITAFDVACQTQERLQKELEDKLDTTKFPLYKTVVAEAMGRMVLDGVGRETVENYSGSLKKHTFKRWKAKRINEITTMMIYELFDENRDIWSEHHRKSMRKFVKSVFTFAVTSNYLSINPMPNIKCKTQRKLNTVLTQNEIVLLIKKAVELDWDYMEVVYLAVKLGMRSGELKALQWKLIDFERNLIFVKHSMLRDGVLKDTKSGEDRTLPMTPSVRGFLLRLRNKTGNSQFVLPRVESWMKGEQARELRSFLKRIGLPEVRFHDLRASWATMLLANGIEPVKLMAMGGWKELKTLDHYVRLAGVHTKDSLDCIDDIKFLTETAEVIELRR